MSLRDRLRSVDSANGAVNGNGLAKVNPGAYNPGAVAQIQIQMLKSYFTESSDVYTSVAPASIVASLKTDIPFFIFNNMDSKSGYAKSFATFPVSSVWTAGVPFVYGYDQAECAFGALDSTVTSTLVRGDLVVPFTAITSGPVNTLCIAVIRMTDGAYSSLLDATNSNSFTTTLLRYTVSNDTAGLAQFSKAISSTNLTMFGKFASDPINPDSYKNPEQQQANIVDIFIEFTANKQTGLATYLAYDVSNVRWNLFIQSVEKVL